MTPRFQVVRDPRRLRVLTAPLALQILQALQTGGEATAGGLAARVARPRVVTYYHLNRLTRAGFVRVVAQRPTGRRPERVYRAVAQELRIDASDPAVDWRADLTRVSRAGLRALERDVCAALARGHRPSDAPTKELAFFARRVRLDAAGLREVNRRLTGILEATLRRDARGAGAVYSLGFALAPVASRARPRPRTTHRTRRTG